jgi:hypothetical protein
MRLWFPVLATEVKQTCGTDITMNLKIGNWIGFGKIGWKIIDRQNGLTGKIGIRPILRRFTNRYYIVYAERIK